MTSRDIVEMLASDARPNAKACELQVSQQRFVSLRPDNTERDHIATGQHSTGKIGDPA